MQTPDGSFYGTTYSQYGNAGEEFPAGTIYRLDPTTGAVVFVETFPNAGPHRQPKSPLLPYNGGLLGVTYATNKRGGIIFYLNPSGTLDVWHTFGRSVNSIDGNSPFAPLVVGPQGDIFGLTRSGGTLGFGVAYKLNPKSKHVQILHNFPFKGPSSPDNLLLGKDGNFYAVAFSSAVPFVGYMFKMTPAGAVTILYRFKNSSPDLTLMQAEDGTFYGTTGGNRLSGATYPYGSLFKMTGTPPNVMVTILHGFGQGNDGKYPVGPVVVGPNGNLYGETQEGGTGSDTGGDGILYEITTDGSTYTILHNFKDGSITNDGAFPAGGLTLGADNNFYGATSEGGAYGSGPFSGGGTLFRLTP